MRKAAQELPDREIRDDEKLDGAEKRGESDARDGAAIAQAEADGHVDEEAGIDYEHQFVEADENVAEEEREKGKEKREAAITQNGAGEERHRADRREIPGVRSDAQGSGKQNQGERKQCAIEQIFFLGHFCVHLVASSICGIRSQNTKPSRFTTSPVRMGMGDCKIGPSKTK